MLTSAAGAITDTYEDDAFGNLIAHSGTTPNAYLYRGERYDADLGLYYLRARWYNPVTGRFMTRDPYQGSIYDPASLHRYNYARANPANFIDPSGRDAAAEYSLATAVDFAANQIAVVALGEVVRCSYFAFASGVELVGETVGQDVLNLWTNFKTCSAKVTVTQLLTAAASTAAFGFAIGAVGDAMVGCWATPSRGRCLCLQTLQDLCCNTPKPSFYVTPSGTVGRNVLEDGKTIGSCAASQAARPPANSASCISPCWRRMLAAMDER
jgi:RHS repeat-associated protein